MQTQLSRRFAALFALAASAATFAQSTSTAATDATRSPASVSSECASVAPAATAAGRESPSRPKAASWDLATIKGARMAQAPSPATAPSATDPSAPAACDHAINTKGTGANNGATIAPRDPATGQATGKRQHGPGVILK